MQEKVVESVNKELDCNKEKPVFWALVVTSKNINIKNFLKTNDVFN